MTPGRLLDLGSGTGRFTGPLARTFGVPVVGLEPLVGMLGAAVADTDDDRVGFVRGRAERLPFRDGAFGAAFVLNVLHHVGDRPTAARELARVVAPSGSLVVTGSVIDPSWTEGVMGRWFPSYPALGHAVLSSVEELCDDLAAGGWDLRLEERVEQVIAPDLATFAEQVALRGTSLLELLPDDEFAAGVARMRAEAAGGGGGPVVDRYPCFVFVHLRPDHVTADDLSSEVEP